MLLSGLALALHKRLCVFVICTSQPPPPPDPIDLESMPARRVLYLWATSPARHAGLLTVYRLTAVLSYFGICFYSYWWFCYLKWFLSLALKCCVLLKFEKPWCTLWRNHMCEVSFIPSVSHVVYW